MPIAQHSLHKGLQIHTCSFEAQEAGDLALTALLLLTGQKLIDKLPDQLLCRSVQHRKNIHNKRVHIPGFHTDKVGISVTVKQHSLYVVPV